MHPRSSEVGCHCLMLSFLLLADNDEVLLIEVWNGSHRHIDVTIFL